MTDPLDESQLLLKWGPPYSLDFLSFCILPFFMHLYLPYIVQNSFFLYLSNDFLVEGIVAEESEVLLLWKSGKERKRKGETRSM